jgi:hypothetical protein
MQDAGDEEDDEADASQKSRTDTAAIRILRLLPKRRFMIRAA